MRIYEEKNLRNFEFWSGAKPLAEMLTSAELDTIEEILEELYPDGMDETEVNDLFWFDCDTIAEWLGYADYDELYEERKDNS